MILSLTITPAIAEALEREAARHGLSPTAWLQERLVERFGLPKSEARR